MKGHLLVKVWNWLACLVIATLLPGCSVNFSAGDDARNQIYRETITEQVDAYVKVNDAVKNGSCLSDVLHPSCQATVEQYCSALEEFRKDALSTEPPDTYKNAHLELIGILESYASTCMSATQGFRVGAAEQVNASLAEFSLLHEDLGRVFQDLQIVS